VAALSDLVGDFRVTDGSATIGGSASQFLPPAPQRWSLVIGNAGTSSFVVGISSGIATAKGISIGTAIGSVQYNFRDVGPAVSSAWFALAVTPPGSIYWVETQYWPRGRPADTEDISALAARLAGDDPQRKFIALLRLMQQSLDSILGPSGR